MVIKNGVQSGCEPNSREEHTEATVGVWGLELRPLS